MYIAATVIIFVICVLLVLVVLVQNSKGGGLASNFASGNQFGGVVQTKSFLEKFTWGLAIALLVFSLVASMSIPRAMEEKSESLIKEQVNNAVDYNVPPTIPSQTQVQQQQKDVATENKEEKK